MTKGDNGFGALLGHFNENGTTASVHCAGQLVQCVCAVKTEVEREEKERERKRKARKSTGRKELRAK